MKKAFVIAFTLLICFLNSSAQTVYNASKFSDAKKMHKKTVSTLPIAISKHDVNKLLISDCYLTMIVSDKFAEKSFGNEAALKKYVIKEMENYVDKVEPGEDYYTLLCNFIFSRFEKLFEENSIEVVKKEALFTNTKYVESGLISNNNGSYSGVAKNVNGGVEFTKTSTKMGKIPPINFKLREPEIALTLAHAAHTLGAKASLRIGLEVEIDDNGILTIQSFTTKIDTYISGYKKAKDMVYNFKVTDNNLFNLIKPIQGTLNYNTASAQDVNKELIEIISSVIEMYSYSLSSEL
ncbi:hypothetical protein OAO55_03685 [Bacteroidales bacterium]|nr:hypothetical protein [Bacteroidales bacterium]